MRFDPKTLSRLVGELGALRQADASKRAATGKTLTHAEQERVKQQAAKSVARKA